MQVVGRSKKVLIGLFIMSLSLLAASLFMTPIPLYGLSTVISITVLSSVLSSMVLSSSVLSSSVLSSVITQQYPLAISYAQLLLSLLAIGVLVYIELTDPSYGKVSRIFEEIRRSWLSTALILSALFFIIVAIRIWQILAG